MLPYAACEANSSEKRSFLMSDSQTITFGKYAGQPVTVLEQDSPYALWLTQQPWFRQKFASLFSYIAARFDLDEETPEHNAMQLKWSQKSLLSRLTYAVYAGHDAPDLDEFDGAEILSVIPEHEGWDIYFRWQTGRDDVCENFVELKPTLGDNYPAVLRTMNAKKVKAFRDASYYIIVGKVTSIAASNEQLFEFFDASKINFILETDAEWLGHPIQRS